MLIPQVVGFRLDGSLPEGATATDLVLRVTQMLREHGVVGKFVEFHGPGLAGMPLANRATIANMAPEYGATVGFFPVDEQTTRYMRLTGRDEALVETVEQYYREQGMWREDARSITYSSNLELDLSTIEPALAGPEAPAGPHHPVGHEGPVAPGPRRHVRQGERRRARNRDRMGGRGRPGDGGSGRRAARHRHL